MAIRTDTGFGGRLGRTLAIYCSLAALGCDRVEARQTPAGSAGASAAMVVDTLLPGAEALKKFQSGLPSVTGLGGGVRNRDELVKRFVAAVESGDEAELDALHVSRAEYAFLYFPTSIYTRKPYELPPDIAWLLSEQASIKGKTRIVRRLGGKRLDLRGYECEKPVKEGENRFWRSCQVDYADPETGQRVSRRLFGAIMERDGSYKLLSYSNDF